MKRALAALAASAAVFAGLAAAPAGADRNASYWTTDQIEASILDSDWAQNWSIDDAACDGRGRPVVTAGAKAYRYFTCYFWSAFNGQWNQVGQVTMLSRDRWRMGLLYQGDPALVAGPVLGP